MEERGWLQRDLAFVLGVPEQGVNMILSGKRNISADMALALADAFDTDGDFFARLQLAYDMAHARVPGAKRGLARQYAVSVSGSRNDQAGWIAQADTPLMEEQLVRFFQVAAADEIPYLAHAGKKSRYEEREIPATPARLALSGAGRCQVDHGAGVLRTGIEDGHWRVGVVASCSRGGAPRAENHGRVRHPLCRC